MTRTITEINIHCSATKPSWMASATGAQRVDEIRRWHVQENGWSDIGYHAIIDRDGYTYPGRPIEKPGAFEPRVNANAIGICLIGGYGASATDAFEGHFTPEQDQALRQRIAYLRQRYPSIRKVTGHNDYAPKGCPGFKVSRWLDGKPAQRSFAESGTAIGSSTATAAAGGLAVIEGATGVVRTLAPPAAQPAAAPAAPPADASPIEKAAAATAEVRSAITEVKAAQAEAHQAAADTADPMRWLLIALILAGAGFALYRRWRDWQAGRQ